ncbi:MAG: DEAD/DEAH box helicase, partial [Acidimicrobiia bacterium]|nr:DEAD/DEAH box helicase [Acidimicrobiia bacterium]
HHFWRVEHTNRLELVAEVAHAHESTLVFTRTRRGADRLARQLHKQGVAAEAIHGGRSQRQRDRALRQFKNGHAEALIATDVAARGIHVDGVECVIHFDPPEDHKAYLHRSGRTARAGADGHVVSFIQHDQVKSNYRLQNSLGLSGSVAKPSVDALLNGGGEQLGAPGERTDNADRSRSRSGGHNGQRRSNSNNRNLQRNNIINRNRSRKPQNGSRNDNRTNSRASDGDGNRRDAEPVDRDGNRRDTYNDRDGNRRKPNSNSGSSRNSNSRRNGKSGGSSRNSNGAGNGNSSGNSNSRRRKAGSTSGGYRGSSSSSRSNSNGRSGGNSSQQRRRKPSGGYR